MLMPRAPWPLDDGGRVGLWQGLRDVARAFDIRLVVMRWPSERANGVPPQVRELGVDVVLAEHRPPPEPLALAHGVVGRWPYTLARFRSPEFERVLRAAVKSWRPDLAFIHHLHLATYVDALGGCTKVLREHNLEQLWLARLARSSRNPAVAAYAALQALRMRATEAELCRRMDLVLAVHEEEAVAIRAFAPGVRVEVVPASARFTALDRRAAAREPALLIIGSFDRGPNLQGARRFLEEGWPLVRSRLPDARLRIVGRGIPATLAALARRLGAEPVGFVPDLASEFARASGIVIPLWYGAGIRVKMIEAVAAGVPVATTSLGAEGLGLEAGRDYLEGRTGAELGAASLTLLEQSERANALAASAHAVLRRNYDTEIVARRTIELCEEALAVGSASRR